MPGKMDYPLMIDHPLVSLRSSETVLSISSSFYREKLQYAALNKTRFSYFYENNPTKWNSDWNISFGSSKGTARRLLRLLTGPEEYETRLIFSRVKTIRNAMTRLDNPKSNGQL